MCLHPSLRCDGFAHPACSSPGSEPEDEEGCTYEEYLEKNIIKSHATYQCESNVFPGMRTWSTPCDKRLECKGGVDEDCSEQLLPNSILISVILAFMIIYLVSNLIYSKCSCFKSRFTEKPTELSLRAFQEFLQEFETNSEDETIKAKANVLLLNIINTKNEKEITECFKSFYASVSRINEGKVDKISIYLHNNIFAKLNHRILEAEQGQFNQ